MNPLRYYDGPVMPDGYPFAWAHYTVDPLTTIASPAIKHLVREQAEHRCVRCGHPYEKGDGEWSRCDTRCLHEGPARIVQPDVREWRGVLPENVRPWPVGHGRIGERLQEPFGRPTYIEAQWRILTVHHLDGDKRNCRWWNLAALCQRCHLSVQTRVEMAREYNRPHSDWFKPYAAGWYAFRYHGQDLSRAEVEARLDELLSLELRQEQLFT